LKLCQSTTWQDITFVVCLLWSWSTLCLDYGGVHTVATGCGRNIAEDAIGLLLALEFSNVMIGLSTYLQACCQPCLAWV